MTTSRFICVHLCARAVLGRARARQDEVVKLIEDANTELELDRRYSSLEDYLKDLPSTATGDIARFLKRNSQELRERDLRIQRLERETAHATQREAAALAKEEQWMERERQREAPFSSAATVGHELFLVASR